MSEMQLGECRISSSSDRTCERGTRACVVLHAPPSAPPAALNDDTAAAERRVAAPPAAQPEQESDGSKRTAAPIRAEIKATPSPSPEPVTGTFAEPAEQDTADGVAEALEFAERRYIGKVGKHLTILAAEVRRQDEVIKQFIKQQNEWCAENVRLRAAAKTTKD